LFSPISSTNKTEILLKVALNTITKPEHLELQKILNSTAFRFKILNSAAFRFRILNSAAF
jgi:hypothetical protein